MRHFIGVGLLMTDKLLRQQNRWVLLLFDVRSYGINSSIMMPRIVLLFTFNRNPTQSHFDLYLLAYPENLGSGPIEYLRCVHESGMKK